MKTNSSLIAVLLGFAIIIACILGWVLNIVAIAHSNFDFSNITGMIVLRIIGVFLAPLGSVLGYL